MIGIQTNGFMIMKPIEKLMQSCTVMMPYYQQGFLKLTQ